MAFSPTERHTKDLFIRYLTKNNIDMTYIVGANCTDGIVLVGDKKITIGQGTQHNYAKKIFSPLASIVIGSSGASGMYRTFQSRLVIGVQDIAREKEGQQITWDEEIILLAERVIHDIASTYGAEVTASNLDALLVLRGTIEPQLIHLTGFGLPEQVTEYVAIGHGEPYGSVLLKTIWNKNKPMTMRTFAKLGCMIVKFIENMNLDNSVGTNEGKELPQVWYIPRLTASHFPPTPTAEQIVQVWNRHPIHELSDSEVRELMKDSDAMINHIKTVIEGFKL